MDWDRIIEEKIREAQQRGEFSDLAGEGRPLPLDENPYEDPAWQTANRVMKAAGFRPDWIEEDVALREALTQARAKLIKARDWRAAQLAGSAPPAGPAAARRRHFVADEWARAQARFAAEAAEINKRIVRLNLKVPLARLQRMLVDVEAELQAVQD